VAKMQTYCLSEKWSDREEIGRAAKLKWEGLVAVFDWKSSDLGGARRSVGAATGQG
jgi:hypothetical protein